VRNTTLWAVLAVAIALTPTLAFAQQVLRRLPPIGLPQQTPPVRPPVVEPTEPTQSEPSAPPQPATQFRVPNVIRLRPLAVVRTVNAGVLSVEGLGANDAAHTVSAGQLSVVGLGVDPGGAQVNVNAGTLSVVGAN
jgi:hypothetical protein